MVCEPCEQGDEPIRRLAKRAREEYERLGPYEDDFVRPPVASFPAHVLEQDPLKVEGSVLETLLNERGSAAKETMSGSEDMIEILVGERDRALREVMTLERERDEAREVGKDLHNQWFSGLFRSYIWRRAAKNYRRERDEARAEIERLTVICEEAGMQVGLLEREVERLRRGIEAYRKAHGCGDLDSEWPAVEGCASCDWERGEGKVREESGDER